MPVNFTSFTATRSGNEALLQWQTAQEQNSLDFSIERSTNGTNYTAIGDVPAAGNSNSPRDYSFTDAAPATGLNYYRLKETDLDHHFMYSAVNTVVFPTSGTQDLVWFNTGGNAAEVQLLNGSNEFYTLTDIDGRAIQKGQLSSGKLYLNRLAAGIYVVQVTTFTGHQMTTKVLIP